MTSRPVHRPLDPWTRRELRDRIERVGSPLTPEAIAPDRQPSDAQPQLEREAGE